MCLIFLYGILSLTLHPLDLDHVIDHFHNSPVPGTRDFTVALTVCVTVSAVDLYFTSRYLS